MVIITRHPLPAFLGCTPHIDHDHRDVRALVDARGWRAQSSVDAARAAFEFVRDEVHHSWDLKSRRVTRTASEVLHYREGLCYAKSHLLAALLRQLGVPSGLAYQRLTFGDTPASGYTTHGLNTAFLRDRWVRLDARGNKPGVDAQFSLDEERLAFAVRPSLAERDYEENHCDVHPAVSHALRSYDDLHALIEHLPDGL